MKTILVNMWMLGIGALAFTQVSCGRKVAASQGTASVSDSAIMARADSIAKAEGRGDTTGNAAKMAIKHTPDEEFVLDIARNYTQEMEIIRLGANNEGDRNMVALAKRMMGTQTQIRKSLDSYIERKGLTFPTDTLVDISYANAYNNHEWDSAWVSLVETDHNNMIARFEAAKTTVSDPELLAMVNTTLPVLQDHLQKVEGLKPHLK